MSLTIVTRDREHVTVSGPDDEGGRRDRIGLALFLQRTIYLRPGEARSVWRALGRQIESARDRRKRAPMRSRRFHRWPATGGAASAFSP